jgi:hypothetical protein
LSSPRSNNNITVDGINALQQALEMRCARFGLAPNFKLEIDGNFWMEELVNRYVC